MVGPRLCEICIFSLKYILALPQNSFARLILQSFFFTSVLNWEIILVGGCKNVTGKLRQSIYSRNKLHQTTYTVIHLVVVDVSCVLVWDHAH